MNVVLFGATGFLGRHVLQALLAAGHDVTVVLHSGGRVLPPSESRCNVRCIYGDLLDGERTIQHVSQAQADAYIQLAWCATPPSYLHDPRNLQYAIATQQLAVVLATQHRRRLVGVGSCAEYDWRSGCLSEDAPLRPESLYAASKASTFLVLEQLSRRSAWPMAWARPFFQYGPGEHQDRLIPTVIRHLLIGQPVSTATAATLRDYLYVEDVAAALVAIAESNLTGPVNIGSGNPVRVSNLVRSIARMLGREHLLQDDASQHPNEPYPLVGADIRKLTCNTRWQPRFTHEQGLEKTISWWERHLAG